MIAPGRLGLALEIMHDETTNQSSALIRNIFPQSTFVDKVQIGDRIISIDGNPINCIDDFKGAGVDAVRVFRTTQQQIRSPREQSENRAQVNMNELLTTSGNLWITCELSTFPSASCPLPDAFEGLWCRLPAG